MINIAICDDDINMAKEIEGLINETACNDSYNLSLFTDGNTLLNTNLMQYDMVFLDIEIGEVNGIDIAVELRKTNDNALIYFVTSHSSYVSEALRYLPFQYMLKPISANKGLFVEEFNRGIAKIKKDRQKVVVKTRYDVCTMDVKNIVYIERINRKVEIFTTSGKVSSTSKFDDLYDKLLPYDFVKCHHSLLINMKFIAKVKGNELVLKNGETLPISRNYLHSTRETYNRFLAGVII